MENKTISKQIKPKERTVIKSNQRETRPRETNRQPSDGASYGICQINIRPDIRRWLELRGEPSLIFYILASISTKAPTRAELRGILFEISNPKAQRKEGAEAECVMCRQTPCPPMCPNADAPKVIGHCDHCDAELLADTTFFIDFDTIFLFQKPPAQTRGIHGERGRIRRKKQFLKGVCNG